MKNLIQRLDRSKDIFLSQITRVPSVAVVLGSGLAELPDRLGEKIEISFESVQVKSSSVTGHRSRFLLGTYCEHSVVFMQGRLHLYEGHSVDDVVFPVRLLAHLGIRNFILTNAGGGLNPEMKPGEILLIRDHINFMGVNPLEGRDPLELGERFIDMTNVYEKSWAIKVAEQCGQRSLPLRQGVYVATRGPSYETPAEVNCFRRMGGDVVGMSTVPEAIALRQMGRRVCAFSCVTNLASGVGQGQLSHDEVLQNARVGYERFEKIIQLAIDVSPRL